MEPYIPTMYERNRWYFGGANSLTPIYCVSHEALSMAQRQERSVLTMVLTAGCRRPSQTLAGQGLRRDHSNSHRCHLGHGKHAEKHSYHNDEEHPDPPSHTTVRKVDIAGTDEMVSFCCTCDDRR
jgi:hypothetical protein